MPDESSVVKEQGEQIRLLRLALQAQLAERPLFGLPVEVWGNDNVVADVLALAAQGSKRRKGQGSTELPPLPADRKPPRQDQQPARRERRPLPIGPMETLCEMYRRRAEQRKTVSARVFTLTLAEFEKLATGDCHYCGARPSLRTLAGNKVLLCNGVDRLNSDLGYEIGNCVSCCTTCNMMKSRLSEADFVAQARRIIDHIDSRVS